MKIPLMRVAIVLVGLLAIAALTLSLGQADSEIKPSVDSYAPSGVAALFSLLKAEGYEVTVDHSLNPTLEKNEVGIVFSKPAVLFDTEATGQDTFLENVRKMVESGGSIINVPIDKTFDLLPRTTATEAIQVGRLGTRQLSISGPLKTEDGLDLDDNSDGVPVWELSNGIAYAKLINFGKGSVLQFSSGNQFTNRYIDKFDNATVLVESLPVVAKRGTRIVFLEGGLGGATENGLLRTIGRWAEAAWYQLIFLFCVMCYTLGKRFGLPEEIRPPQRGSRELLDAVADTYKRARASKGALKYLYRAKEAQLRRDVRVSRDASILERNRKLADEDALVLAEIEQALAERKLPAKMATEYAIKLEKVCDNYGSSKRKAGTKH